MNRAKTLWLSLVLGCSVLLAGCGYVVLPIAQCTQTSDCDLGKYCQSGRCASSQGGSSSVGETCQQSSDCKSPLFCQKNVCQSPVASQGEGAETTGSSENTTQTEPSTSAEIGPSETTTMDGGNDPDGGSVQDGPNVTPDNHVPVPQPTVQSVSADGCLPGTLRHCLFKQWNTDPQPCGHGQQTCQFDQTWDSCKGRALPAPWFPPSKKEACDEVDNNCDGYVDEGCLESTTGCSIDYAHRYSPPTHHIAFSRTEKYVFSEQRQVALHITNKSNSLQLSKLVFPAQDMQQPQMNWLMEFPAVDQYPYSYDMNQQGELVAMSNGKKVIVWHVVYANDGTPSIRAYSNIAVENVYMLGWGGDGRDLILYQYEYNTTTRKPLIRFFHWRVDAHPTDGMTLRLTSQVVPQPLGHETSNEFQKTRLSIHPNGKWLVLAHYSSLSIYRLPDFQLLKVIKLGSPVDPEFRTVAFHPKRNRLVLAPFQYHKIMTFDITTDAQGVPVSVEQNIYGTQGLEISALDKIGFHPTTGDLYVQTHYGMFRWKDTNDTAVQQPEFIAGIGSVFAMHNASDLVAIGNGQGWISLVHTQSGKRLASWIATTPEGYTGYIQTLEFSPDGSELLVSHLYGVQLWKLLADGQGGYSVKSGQKLVTLAPEQPRSVRLLSKFSSDGKLLAVAQNQNIAVWARSAQDGTWSHAHDLTGHTQNITMMSIHASGQWLVSAAEDKQLRLWSLGSQPTSQVLKTYNEVIKGVTFYSNEQKEDFIFVSLERGDTFAWSFEQGTPHVVTELSGSLSNSGLISPVYFYNPASSYFFTVSKTASSNEENLVTLRDIYISPKQPGQPRTISLNGVNRLMPHPGLTLAVQYDRTRRSLFGFTPEEIRVWVCPNR